ncbi:HAD-superfamily hydrolase, subfamily IA, variant 1 [Halorhabdus utahensis DSM 12940]|uniref:HAD-superfamily hydrolase, subfamily IA, variant 1 n=1 Tax=Halorhabdus utahensis (strain DSM 12940 / JCM 11049 / AX-2) TaxID=519442 RepID=C7NS62_HALUD|nr:HAD-IA family hydrolase [Halorhabdus utahensis]ACV10669.1 HAD-superfamily hydrolase, subfamily IA, variant 1 [Halorhabdus utahensis DSM 12940]
MTIRAVCFDLDDTLFAYRKYARAGLRAAADRLEARTGEEVHEELLRLYFTEGITDGTFDQLLDRHDRNSKLVDDLVDAYHDANTPLSPYPETEPVLSTLSEGYRLGLITDGRGGHAKLRRLGIRSYFDAVVVTPTIESSKRESEPFERVLSTLSVSADAAVYVGDDPRFDFENPNHLGMTTVRLRRGRYSDLEPKTDAAVPDREIPHLEALLDIL